MVTTPGGLDDPDAPKSTPTPVVDSEPGVIGKTIVEPVTVYMGDLGFSLEDGAAAMAKANEARMSYLYKMGTEIFDIEQDAVDSLGRGSASFDNLRKGTIQAYEEFYTMSTDNNTAISTFFEDQKDLVDQYMGIMSSQIMKVHMLKKDVSADDMANIALQKKALGFNAKQMDDFLTRQFSLTGEANDDLLKQALAYSNSLEVATGVSSKIIAGNISGMMSNVELFGNMTVEEMSQAAAAIALVGLEVNDVASMIKKFNTFEGAAESVSKLTQTFGVQLDTMELMTAANESPEALALMLQESFDMAGVDMSSMDMPAKRMLASALGGIGVDDVEKLLGPAGQGLSQYASKIEGATEGVSAADISQSLKKAEGDIETVNRLGTSAIDAARKAAALANKAMVASFSSEMNTMQVHAQKISTEISKSAALLGAKSEDFANALGLNSLVETMETGSDKVIKELQEFNESLGAGTKGGYKAIFDKHSDPAAVDNTPASNLRPVVESSIKEVTTAVKATMESTTANAESRTVSIAHDATKAEIAAYTIAIQNATQGKMENAQRETLKTMMTNWQRDNPKQPITITLIDTVDGFKAKLDKHQVMTVS